MQYQIGTSACPRRTSHHHSPYPTLWCRICPEANTKNGARKGFRSFSSSLSKLQYSQIHRLLPPIRQYRGVTQKNYCRVSFKIGASMDRFWPFGHDEYRTIHFGVQSFWTETTFEVFGSKETSPPHWRWPLRPIAVPQRKETLAIPTCWWSLIPMFGICLFWHTRLEPQLPSSNKFTNTTGGVFALVNSAKTCQNPNSLISDDMDP